MLGVIGIGNVSLDGKFRDKFFISREAYFESNCNSPSDLDTTPDSIDGCMHDYSNLSSEAPGFEYAKIGKFVGNFIDIMRISMGDFGVIGAVQYLEIQETILFWIVWFLAVFVNCIIFLNFIVAEAGNSYNEVQENLTNIIVMQKASQVAEAQEIIPSFLVHQNNFPKFLVVRKVES